jgi:hypothetical protein
MIDRLNLYDLLSGLVPGTLLVSSVAVLFPGVAPALAVPLPNEFAVVALLAASLVAGLLVQTAGSLVEPVTFKIFGGRPSDLAFEGKLGDRYLPTDAADRIKKCLRERFGAQSSERSLFLRAMGEAEAAETSKAKAFNGQYAFHRSILVLFASMTALVGLSRFFGRANTWSGPVFWFALASLLSLSALFAWRTWQRGAYYAREVLFTAERLARSQPELTTGPSAGPPR